MVIIEIILLILVTVNLIIDIRYIVESAERRKWVDQVINSICESEITLEHRDEPTVK